MNSASHHASDETLLAYAAGTLTDGPSLVVATHLALCPACRAAVSRFEAIGGAMVEELDAVALRQDALNRIMARLDETVPPPAPVRDRLMPDMPDGIDIPSPLRAHDIGKWRFLAPGARWSRIALPRSPRANVMLLRVAPGIAMPSHGHVGREYTCVISGAFEDITGRYGPGDMAEADADLDHEPVVCSTHECVCLIAMDGKLRIHSVLGRLMQPFLGL